MLLKLGHFGKQNRNTWKVLKCGAEEERTRSAGTMACEVSQRVKGGKELHTIKRKANWNGHILGRNCRLKHIIEGEIERRIELKGRRGRRRRQLLDDLVETRVLEFARSNGSQSWRTRFGKGYGPVVKMTEQEKERDHLRNVKR